MRVRSFGIGLSAALLVCVGVWLRQSVTSDEPTEDVGASTNAVVAMPPASKVTTREPTTSPAAQPLPGSESPPIEPFKPQSAGPAAWDESPKPLWAYEDLTAEERTVVDRGRDVSAWSQTHNGFQTAVRERALRARSDRHQGAKR